MKGKILISFMIMVVGFSSLFICSSIAIEDPDYTETIPAGSRIYFTIDLEEGKILIIEFEVIEGGNKDIDLYIEDSNGYIVEDYGRVISGTIYFIVPYDDEFKIYFSNSFSIFTSKTVEISFDITYAKSITIYSPRSTDLFENGCNDIKWTTTGDITQVRIELYRGTSFVEVIDSQTYNDGVYSWCLFSSDSYDGSIYRIKISDYYDSNVYTFSEYFTIRITPESTQTFFVVPLFWGLLIIIPSISAFIGAIIFLTIRKKRKFSKEIIPIKTQKIVETKKEEIPRITYCSLCGVKIVDPTAEYCSECGAPLK